MAKRKKKTSIPAKRSKSGNYDGMLGKITDLLESARRTSARTVNAIMTFTYWEIGRQIVEFELGGKERADYGSDLLKRISVDLTTRFGRGFSWRNLHSMRKFYQTWPILQTPSAKSDPVTESLKQSGICQTLSVISAEQAQLAFPLPWSHYVRLMSVKKKHARTFYESEAVRGGWSVRQLERQINSQFYERTALSKNKAAMLTKGQKAKPGDLVTTTEEIKDPYVLEFLDLKDEYSESDLEEALIHKLEEFLLELGGDFTFVGRQRRLRIE